MLNKFLSLTNLESNGFTVFVLGIWPTLIFFLFIIYLKNTKAQISIRKYLLWYGGIGAVPPLLWALLSSIIHSQYWQYLPMIILIILVPLSVWPGVFPRTIAMCYLKNKAKYEQIFSVNNVGVEQTYLGRKLLPYVFSFCFLSILFLFPLVGGGLLFIPFQGPVFGNLAAMLIFGPCFFAYIYRWIFRCQLCHLPIFDYTDDEDKKVLSIFKNSWKVYSHKRLKCCNCKAVFKLN